LFQNYQEILAYLALFTEPTGAGTTKTNAHPADLVLNMFPDPDRIGDVVLKCKNFLEESVRVHGKRFECAPVPDLWPESILFLLRLFQTILLLMLFLLWSTSNF